MRLLVSPLAALAALTFLAGNVSAAAEIRTVLELPHAEMELDDDDTGTMAVGVRVYAKEFVCVQDKEITVEVKADGNPYPAHYGTSLNPNTKKFIVATGGPGNGEVELKPADDTQVMWEVNWNHDSRPDTGAKFTYKLLSRTKYDVAGCPLMPGEAKEATIEMTAVGRDKQLGNLSEDCQPGDPRPECSTETAPPPPEDSPGFDTLLVLVAAAGLAYTRRRKA